MASLTLFGLVSFPACSSSLPLTQSEKQGDAQAKTVGLDMERYGAGRPPMPLNDAAWQVVHAPPNSNIRALLASGTTYSGEVVLQITTDTEQDRSTVCYRYNFTRSGNDFIPNKLTSCPPSSVALTAPVPEPVVNTPSRLAALTALLHQLTDAQLANPASVRAQFVAIFPPPIDLGFDRTSAGTFELVARTFDTCVAAYVTVQRKVTVAPGHGADCHGG